MKNNGKNSVLIVDDEPANIVALRQILSPEYVVYGATDGKTAITAATEKSPDLILLDVLMPDMDGYEVLGLLKSKEETNEIPVIFVTGLDNEEAEEKGLSLGAEDYIIKPFNSVLVKLRVRNLLQLVNRTRAVKERFRQQALITKISHSFLTDASIDSLLVDTVRMVGEFMGVSQILLFRLLEAENQLICQCEWRDTATDLKTRLGERIELEEVALSIMGSLNANNENNLCLHSNDPSVRNALAPYRMSFQNYIMTPIYVKGKFYAILDFSRKDEGADWTESEIDLAVHVASILSSAFERDAIERKYSAAEFDRALAERSSSAKSEFLARMSHEMLTPMNAIMGFMQIAKMTDNPEKIKTCIEKIDNASNHLLAMLRNVLDVSDGSNAFTIAQADFSIKKTIKDVVDKVKPDLKKKGQKLSLLITQSIPETLIGDEKRIAQVMTHLLSNAIKFSPEQGKISLDVSILEEKGDAITLRTEVADEGIGVSEEQKKSMFDLFEQADGGMARQYEGIGIGLPLSKCIVRMMNGDIWVESELGKGSRFIFTCVIKRG